MADVQLGLYHHPPLMMTVDGIEVRARGLGVDLSSVDLDSITLPADQDIGILSDDEEELRKEDPPELEMGFGNTIVVDNVPIVLPEKFEKLEKVLQKILSAAGVIKEGGFWMPVNVDTNKTYGYCFIEFNTPKEAELAREISNGYRLDESHVLIANIFDDFERYMKVPDEMNPYTPVGNMKKWL